jgi:hypothetical protein
VYFAERTFSKTRILARGTQKNERKPHALSCATSPEKHVIMPTKTQKTEQRQAAPSCYFGGGGAAAGPGRRGGGGGGGAGAGIAMASIWHSKCKPETSSALTELKV